MRTEGRPNTRRIASRRPVTATATLHVGDAATPVAVTDIAPQGCRIEAAEQLQPGELVSLVLAHNTVIGGRVAWQDALTTGIAFGGTLPPRTPARMLELGRRA